MNRKGFTLFLSAILIIATMAVMVSASGWQQFRTDEANAGIAADSVATAAPDDVITGDAQPALQGAEVSDSGNDAGYLHGLANWTRYDFDVGAGTDKWAYRDEVADKPPTTCDVPNIEFSSYTAISADDGTYQHDYSNNNYAAHRFNFSIDEDAANITAINVIWNGKGYRSGGDGATLYICNGTGYKQLNSTNLATEVYLTGGVTSSISSYINAGNVTVLVEQNTAGGGYSSKSNIDTDYVKVVVTP